MNLLTYSEVTLFGCFLSFIIVRVSNHGSVDKNVVIDLGFYGYCYQIWF